MSITVDEFFLSLFGIFLSLFGVFLSLFKWWQSSRKYKISYSEHIDRLLIPKEYGNIRVSVSYKGEDCTLPSVMARLRLINEGKNDLIFKQKFDKPIEIKSSVVRIVDFCVTQSNEDINSEVKTIGDALYLSWGLLKSGESISLDVFGHVTKVEKIANLEGRCFSLSCRAADISGISKRLPNMSQLKKFLSFLWTIVCFFVFVTFMGHASELRVSPLLGDILYNEEVVKDAKIWYDVVLNKYVLASRQCNRRFIPAEEVPSITMSNIKLSTNNFRLINLSILAVSFLLLIFLYIFVLEKIRKTPSYLFYHLFE